MRCVAIFSISTGERGVLWRKKLTRVERPMFQLGEWAWSLEHQQVCRVVEIQDLWGERLYRVWLPANDAIVRVRESQLRPPGETARRGSTWLAYLTAAARVADALTQDVLLAPIEASVIPLPHQIRALSRAVSDDRVRYLLADEVGLGKTIEAGLIMRELKLRGMVRRTLVVAPKGLVTQWVAEMRTHFDEEFRLFIPSDFSAFRRIAQKDNVWQTYDQVVCPMDSVKPLEGRRGWSRDRVAEYNRDRFEDLAAAGWDLIIVDEAHRLGGSTEQVARYKLGRGLAEAAPYLLLLSATPHQGKTDAFQRLVSLVDEDAFPDPGSISRERVQPFVIRTEKRRAIDAEGEPLFKPRTTKLVPIAWETRHAQQRTLYEAVTEYVREGYNQAVREKKGYIGFLMILMQRLVTSSTRAIRTTLERRLEALAAPSEQLLLFPELSEEEWVELDSQEQIDLLLTTRLKALKNERAEVKLLLEAAKGTEKAGVDAKAEALLDWIYRLQQEDGDPELKVLIFTEFVPTQEMLHEFLTDRGFSVVCLNGSMGMEDRARVQRSFAEEARVLVSTDAGGEGLNLQFCHMVINYDIPWNPMKLEQRIGRVDRIGQEHAVRAVNFVVQDTVEHRVREVLEEKLAVILEEFGVDKTGDILDSAQAGQLFDDLYVEAILRPDALDRKLDSVVNQVKEQGKAVRESGSILGNAEDLDPGQARSLMSHPLPHWIERMTVNYVLAHGGAAERNGRTWNMTWPGGESLGTVVFSSKDADRVPAARHLTLEEPRVRELATRIPRFAPGQPMPCLLLKGLPSEVRGFWSLWQITLHAPEWNQQRIMPLFRHEDGRILAPTARFVWDQMMAGPPDAARRSSPQCGGHLEDDAALEAFRLVEAAAREYGQQIYQELVQAHRARLGVEREKGEYALAARRRAVERIGLPAVRDHRLTQLAAEERSWRDALDRRAETSPELVPLLLVRVEGGGGDG
ncbi:MAG: DEAD/DEAH box helicase family protein [Polyangiaceae bacterium]|nr:DEAD/DEAH box helicase family protein [Polyangiaceae bacterium]